MSAPVMVEPFDFLRAEPCMGLPSWRYGDAGGTPCGRLIDLSCPRCGVGRCRECAVHGVLCPSCPITDPETHAVPALVVLPGGSDR